jgi:hypothetical protein
MLPSGFTRREFFIGGQSPSRSYNTIENQVLTGYSKLLLFSTLIDRDTMNSNPIDGNKMKENDLLLQ